MALYRVAELAIAAGNYDRAAHLSTKQALSDELESFLTAEPDDGDGQTPLTKMQVDRFLTVHNDTINKINCKMVKEYTDDGELMLLIRLNPEGGRYREYLDELHESVVAAREDPSKFDPA